MIPWDDSISDGRQKLLNTLINSFMIKHKLDKPKSEVNLS